MFAHSMHALLGKTLYIAEQNEKVKEENRLIKNDEKKIIGQLDNENNENKKTCCVIL